MQKAKLLCIIISFITILNFTLFTYADDEIGEIDVTKEEIEEILQASSDLNNIPVINSRNAIVYDRISRKSIVWEKRKHKMQDGFNNKNNVSNSGCRKYKKLKGKSESVSKSSRNRWIKTWIKNRRFNNCRRFTIWINALFTEMMRQLHLLNIRQEAFGEFANLMNKKAEELKLKDTHFVTPHGLDEDEHYTTPYELAKISDYALKLEKIANIVKTKTYTVNINGNPKNINNTNELLGYLEGVYGVKTGFTNGANRCLVTSVKREDMNIICVVLGADTKKDRTKDSIKLIEYTFSNFQMNDFKFLIEDEFDNLVNITKFNITKGINNNLKIDLEKNDITLYPVHKENVKDIKIETMINKNLIAPVLENDKLRRT